MADDIDINIKSNARQIAAILGGVAREQIPFATARALTDMAFEGMREAKTDLAESLTLRNRFSVGGIQVNRAEKSAWPKITAEVGIEERRSYLIDHVLGGKRSPKSSPFKAVPQIGPVKRTGSGKIRGNQRPGQLLKRVNVNSRKSAYTYRLMRRGDAEALLRWEKGRTEPVVLYWFSRKVDIDREFRMDAVVQAVVASDYERAFVRRLQQAISSSRRRPG